MKHLRRNNSRILPELQNILNTKKKMQMKKGIIEDVPQCVLYFSAGIWDNELFLFLLDFYNTLFLSLFNRFFSLVYISKHPQPSNKPHNMGIRIAGNTKVNSLSNMLDKMPSKCIGKKECFSALHFGKEDNKGTRFWKSFNDVLKHTVLLNEAKAKVKKRNNTEEEELNSLLMEVEENNHISGS